MHDHYDAIIIGTGAGGGTLAHKLAPSAKKILILERGPFLPRERENWDTVAVMQKERYHTTEVWYDRHGKPIHPGTGYWVGGNTKVYGAALFRLRERDFQEVAHKGGISPAWPLSYDDFEPYYAEAERLYGVHGRRGSDPTEPASGEAYPFSAVPHEPRIQEIADGLTRNGYHPFPVPLGVRLHPQRLASPCIRCSTCDGFPCLVDAKEDADTTCIRPALKHPNVTLITEATVVRLTTDASGRIVDGVVANIEGREERFSGDVVIVAGGAINSAVLLLHSANAAHPNGLGNANDLVGRNFMKHNNGAIAAVGRKPNRTVFQKTLAMTDFYWGDERYPYPMGSVQLLGKLNKDMLRGDAPPLTPDKVLDELATHSVDWFLTTEDLPDEDNCVRIDRDGRIILDYTENNLESYETLSARFTHALKSIDCANSIVPCSVYLRKQIPLQGVAHQVGTCRFGNDPANSVLDENCRMHELDNVYVVDGSFFPSSGAVNPSLTIIANALRVGDHLLERMGAAASVRLPVGANE
ncbi:MAG: GMC family oxidoreductase [Candidatus Eremiobacteraeota bacterium]|nr:GMC family oxidoreductase [Candidatus Eremiobacteraeota bacterium]